VGSWCDQPRTQSPRPSLYAPLESNWLGFGVFCKGSACHVWWGPLYLNPLNSHDYSLGRCFPLSLPVPCHSEPHMVNASWMFPLQDTAPEERFDDLTRLACMIFKVSPGAASGRHALTCILVLWCALGCAAVHAGAPSASSCLEARILPSRHFPQSALLGFHCSWWACMHVVRFSHLMWKGHSLCGRGHSLCGRGHSLCGRGHSLFVIPHCPHFLGCAACRCRLHWSAWLTRIGSGSRVIRWVRLWHGSMCFVLRGLFRPLVRGLCQAVHMPFRGEEEEEEGQARKCWGGITLETPSLARICMGLCDSQAPLQWHACLRTSYTCLHTYNAPSLAHRKCT